MRSRNKKSVYRIEASILLGLCLVVYMPWGCSKSPLAPGVPIVESTFLLPDGTIAYPGTKLSDRDPASPDSALKAPVNNEPGELDPLDTTGSTGGIVPIVYEKEVDTLGGSIAMDIDGKTAYFYIPKGGLTERTTITVEVYRDYSRAEEIVTEFHFGPVGLTFVNTSQLVFPTVEADGETMELLWWNKWLQEWMFSAEAIVVSGHATFPVTHFSKYRTKERISLGGQGKS